MRFLNKALFLLVTALFKTMFIHLVVVWANNDDDDDDQQGVTALEVDVVLLNGSNNNNNSNSSNILPPTRSVDFLRLQFTPAVLYQQALHQEHDRLYFIPTDDGANTNNTIDNGCWYQCIAENCHTLCGGTFTIDYTDYEVLEITFRFNDETLLRPSSSDPRIRVALYAQAVNCTNGELLLNKFVRPERIKYTGSNVSALVDNYDPTKSFVQITRCSIATKLEFIASNEDTVLEANVTSITWKIALDNVNVRRLGRQTYFFDTSMPLWIEVPSDHTNDPTSTPTTTTTSTTTFEPTRVVILSKEEPTTRPGSSGGGGPQNWNYRRLSGWIGWAVWTMTMLRTLLGLVGW